MAMHCVFFEARIEFSGSYDVITSMLVDKVLALRQGLFMTASKVRIQELKTWRQ
jgi:hypothetical protein